MAEYYGRNQAKRVSVTRSGHAASRSGQASDGEEIGGVGSRHSAVLNERRNKSLNRNAGPSRSSANSGTIPQVGQSSRNTGRVR